MACSEPAEPDDAAISATASSTIYRGMKEGRCSARSAPTGSRAEGCSCSRRIEGDYFAILGLPLLELLGFPARRAGGGEVVFMKITGAARLAGIMGWPVAHSRSPVLHGFWLDETRHRRRLCAVAGAAGQHRSRRCARCRRSGFAGAT